MIIAFRYFTSPLILLLVAMLRVPGYYLVLRKMPLNKWTALIPFLAEREMSKVLFRKLRTFYRPFIITAVFFAGSLYLGLELSMGRIFLMIAVVVYGWFQARLYWRLGKSFGAGVFFRILLILFPYLFLIILGLSKAEYKPLELKPVKKLPFVLDWLLKGLVAVISVAEVAALVVGVGYISINTRTPDIMVLMNLEEFRDKTKDIAGTKEVISREDMMGSDAAKIDTMETSREKFFPDHSQDKSAVVLTYIVGSNLEDQAGLASANITQMIESTKAGDALTYVLQTGGSDRWFTSGIDKSTVGRYEIRGGDLTKVEELPGDTCMSEEKSLEDFLLWAKDKYQADRYMLVLWDHGGGVAMGFGEDDLNKKEVEKDELDTMRTSEVIEAVRKSGIKFDVIGFDACLMQDIEIAAGMEPYADYYLASEETEGGYGWYYTSPFGKLARDPGMSTEDLAVDLLSCYDQMNTIIKDGKKDTKATLSLVDTTLAKPAYEGLEDLLVKADEQIKKDPGAYADMAVAGTNAYNFSGDSQIDLIDYLDILKKADYDDEIAADDEIDELLNKIRACVLYRNKDSAAGINGMAFAFPYKSLMTYSYTADELKAMSLKTERRVFNDVFSIMAAQKIKASKQEDYQDKVLQNAVESDDFISALLSDMSPEMYAEQDWYVKGFEDYDNVEAVVDIPLIEGEDGYKIDLPKQAWDIVIDCQTMVWRKTENDELQYLGRDQIGGTDENGNPTVAMDDTWIKIGGETVCYEAEPVRETDDGDVYSGKVRAKLNDEQDVMLEIEWDPVKDGSDEPKTGHVTGYYDINAEIFSSILNKRSSETLKPGDTLQFIYDFCDQDGKVLRTEPSGKKVRVIKPNDLKVEDAYMGDQDIVVNGVLTDIYQRTMTTEQIELHVGD